MKSLELALAIYLALGIGALSAWAVKIYVTTDLAPTADLTSRCVYRLGQLLIWVGTLLISGGLLGVGARAVWLMLGGA